MEIAKKLVALQQELKDMGAISFGDYPKPYVLMRVGSLSQLGIPLSIKLNFTEEFHKVYGLVDGVEFTELANDEDIAKYYPQFIKEDDLND